MPFSSHVAAALTKLVYPTCTGPGEPALKALGLYLVVTLAPRLASFGGVKVKLFLKCF